MRLFLANMLHALAGAVSPSHPDRSVPIAQREQLTSGWRSEGCDHPNPCPGFQRLVPGCCPMSANLHADGLHVEWCWFPITVYQHDRQTGECL